MKSKVTRAAENPLGDLRKPGKRRCGKELVESIVHGLLAENDALRTELAPFKRLRREKPQELADLFRASGWDEYHRMASSLSKLSSKRKRSVNLTPEQKREHAKTAKCWYERTRKIRRGEDPRGLIEQQFSGDRKFDFINGRLKLPTGPCLDELLRGNEVKMPYLERLFGIERHRLAKHRLERHEQGRETSYGYRAFLHVAGALLQDANPRRAWLSNPEKRLQVLCGIEQRIREISPSPPRKIADEFRKFVKHHRTLIREKTRKRKTV